VRARIAVLLICGVVAFWNAMPAPFILDDTTAVVQNRTIRTLWPLSVPLQPPSDTPVARRPLVNLTLAANYAWGGMDPVGYHAVNLAIHLLAALALFGIVRRTLLLPPPLAPPQAPVRASAARSSPVIPGAVRRGGSSDPPAASAPSSSSATNIAWIAALLWLLHPLNSEVVDYVTQRSESLMGLAYLLTMYCAIRAWNPPAEVVESRAKRRAQTRVPAGGRETRWEAAAVICCAAGMLCKESMVTAPVAVVLYDRVFRFGTLSDAFRRRARIYSGLALSWVLLAAMMWSGGRTTAGFASGVSAVTYLANQVRLIPHYLLLSVWPRALVVDYGLTRPIPMHDLIVPAIVLAAVVVGGVILFVRRPRIGFGVLFFFLTLAPTSSFVPIATEVGAERRMYLPLAGLIAVAVPTAYWLLRRVPARARVAVACLVCLLAGAGTFLRNREYRNTLTLARATATRWPSGRSRFFYGTELVSAGREEQGIAELRLSAVDYPGGHYALGTELIDTGRTDEGLAHLREFIRLAPTQVSVGAAHDLIGRVLETRGEFDAAAAEFQAVLAREPGNLRALVFLGDVRFRQQRMSDAVEAYQRARRVDPALGGDATVLGRLAAALASIGRVNEAVSAAQQGVAQRPDDPELQKMLGQTLALNGRVGDAVPHFRRAVELAPGDAQARQFLATAERQAVGR
jgi:tetratricopeptide (TPR) repeat protein